MPTLGQAALVGILARSASLVASFFLVATVYRSLDVEGYALYAVATTISGLLPFLDFGLGFGMVTRLSHAAASGRSSDSRRIVSTSFFVLVGASLALTLIVVLAAPIVPWGSLLGVESKDAGGAGLIVLLGVAASISSSVGSRVLFSLQRAHVGYAWDIGSAILVLGSSALGPLFGGSALFYIAVIAWSPVVVGFAQTAWTFLRAHPDLSPSLADFSRTEIKPLLSLGVVYSYGGLAVAVGVQGNVLILSHLGSNEDVIAYSIAIKLASMFFIFASVGLTPLWPAFGRAIAMDDLAYIRRTLLRVMAGVTIISMAFVVTLTAVGPRLISVWVGDTAGISRSLLLLVAAATAARVLVLPLNMLLNGAAVKKMQVLATTAVIVVSLPLALVLTVHLGASGPPVGTLAGTVAGMLAPYAIFVVRRYLRDNETPARKEHVTA